MALIVQKFGGTSVADTTKILAAARKAIRETKKGNQVVMVVSAMGKNTDHLVSLAKEISDHPNSREMDMLMSSGEQVTVALMAIALESLGHKAVSYTAAQIGIRTDNDYMKARIKSISTERMRKSLNEGKIIIAAGFQGIDDDLNITTLGRGGSDTTAVALAAALGADSCDIYTDVDGVYTTDPRVVPEARKLDKISYDEMLEMASMGAGVMHSRSIEFAKKFGTRIHVRSSFSDTPGTIIGPETESLDVPVCGAAMAKNEAQITVVGVPDVPGAAMKLFSRIAEAKVPIDMIVQNASEEEKTDISFTVAGDDLALALEAVRRAATEVGAEDVMSDASVSKISIVGLGMVTQHGVARRMLHVLANAGINIQMITTSEIKVSALVSRDKAVEALRAVHREFQLDVAPEKRSLDLSSATEKSAEKAASVSTQPGFSTELVSRMTGMENILIDNIALDSGQMRITLSSLPDVPGNAAAIFDQIAADQIIVDMIVQSACRDGKAVISFTMPKLPVDQIQAFVDKLAQTQHCKVAWNPAVAKLTLHGTGLRSHTDLALRMFSTLSQAKINVSIISTSERSLNVVVGESAGVRGLELLKMEFVEEML